MTGLEDNVKGKTFFKTENGEYKELRTLKSIEIGNENKEEYINILTDTEVEFECTVTDKDIIRKFEQLAKTEKDKKVERILNKNSFRNFIKNI